MSQLAPTTTPEPPFEGTMSINQCLDNGIGLAVLFHSWTEMRWIAKHRYLEGKRLGRSPKLINEWTLIADFDSGLLKPQLKLSMHIIIPERLGQASLLGVDISPGAKTYLEFLYERPQARIPMPTDDPYWKNVRPGAYPEGLPGPFYLAEISKGIEAPIDTRPLTFPESGPGLIKPISIEFPFPFECRIDWRHGYHVPFLNEGETMENPSYFQVPNTLRR